jgi:galactose oxidase
MTTTHLRRLFGTLWLVAAVALAAKPQVNAQAPGGPDKVGQWGPRIDMQNVPIHTHVLPDGRVLYWSRREKDEDINPHVLDCTPRIWDPKTGTTKTTDKPGFNLFCGGHTFLADGRLFAAGGHQSDGHGDPHAAIFDYTTEKWTRVPNMNAGRWYPTAVMLPDGSVLVSFGKNDHGDDNTVQQVWKDGLNPWRPIVDFQGPPYYPRMHVVPDGRVFMAGPLPLTQFLDTNGGGAWTFLRTDPDPDKARQLSSRVSNRTLEYATSVQYADGKILFAGGGNAPANGAEVLDLNADKPAWKSTDNMIFHRRQHNATLLPDGTVLVTGGTQGNGGPAGGFNDLTPGAPIHSAELWDPKTGHWTKMAKESVDRCYHSTAVLLPDATVLSAGGGEYSPNNDGKPNDARDSHRDAQIFSPPYLFRGGVRPTISSAPDEVEYGKTFKVVTPNPADVGAVNWVRLSSVTHSFNSNQRINFLAFQANATSVSVTAPPDNRNICPPGHYMLFVLNKSGVPSVAKIIRIH